MPVKECENTILVDADGVLLNWDGALHQYLKELHNVVLDNEDLNDQLAFYSIADRYKLDPTHADILTQSFNNSLHMRNLAPLPNAVPVIRRLYEQYGIKFHVITAIGDHPLIRQARIENLHSVFGSNVWKAIDFVGINEHKSKYLLSYANSSCIWIEDYYKNAAYGASIGLQPILVRNPTNEDIIFADDFDSRISVGDDWLYIETLILRKLGLD